MSSAENTKLCDFTSTNNNDFICTPIAPPADTAFYEIKPALLNLVMREQFSGVSTNKMDAIMSMLASGKTHVDPNNTPLSSLVAQEEHVDVNLIRNNNFNNNAYRNNFGNNNYKPYPSNNSSYSNPYSRTGMPNEERISEVEKATK